MNSNDKTWSGVYWLAFVGLCLRIIFALTSDTIFHPDELFQYLEQAHRLVFGYGYVPWEYRFGIRSWIIPGFISIWLFICSTLHLDDPAIYIPLVKGVFCLLSTSLIFSAYTIGRSLISEEAGRLAGIFTCFWYELIYFAHKPLPDALAAYLLIGALAYAVAKVGRKPILFGLLLALCVVIRFQLLPVVAFMALFICFAWTKKELIRAGLAFVGVGLLAGYVDYLTWGYWFISYYNNFLFNGIYGVSNLFGQRSYFYYPAALTIGSVGIFAIAGLLSLTVLKRVWLPLICASIILVFYSIVPHKEYRYVFAAIPLLLIITSALIFHVRSERIPASRRDLFYGAVLVGFVCLSAAGLYNRLPYQNKVYGLNPLYIAQDDLKAYMFLAREQNLVAIMNSYNPWGRTGGYYYLHRDVPIYFANDLRSELNANEMANYVTHIVCSAAAPEVKGFRAVKRIGNLEIRKQISFQPEYKRVEGYTRHVFKKGIDDTYEPMVRARF